MIAEPSNWVLVPMLQDSLDPQSMVLCYFTLACLSMSILYVYVDSEALHADVKAFGHFGIGLSPQSYYDLVSHNPSVIDSEFLMQQNVKKITKLIRSRPKHS